MPSPFPGMNPYLERPALWPDFHNTYLPRLRGALAALVRPRYFVRLQENVYLRELPDRGVGIRVVPDLGVRGGPPRAGGPAAATAVAPARVRLPLPAVEEVREPRVEVVSAADDRLVTVVELLSPTNKLPGGDRAAYLTKRSRLVRAGVNYVELDLLRAGPRSLDDLPACDYAVLVARSPDLPRADLWPLGLADPLPPVPVPLRPGEAEPLLDLQAVLHVAYDEAGYADYIYRHPPDPPLTPEQAAWAAALMPQEAAR